LTKRRMWSHCTSARTMPSGRYKVQLSGTCGRCAPNSSSLSSVWCQRPNLGRVCVCGRRRRGREGAAY
jgi:hypothetical protein